MLFVTPAKASANFSYESYEEYEDIPEHLLNKLLVSMSKTLELEWYIQRVAWRYRKTLDRIARKDGSKEKRLKILKRSKLETIHREEAKYIAIKARREHLLDLSFFYIDQNNDAKITRAEAAKGIMEYILVFPPLLTIHKKLSHKERWQMMFDKIFEQDLNQDGIVTYKEATQVPEERIEKRIEKVLKSGDGHVLSMQEFDQLDINQDQKLTSEELYKQAQKAFFTIDLNKDTMVSSDEWEQFHSAYKAIRKSLERKE